MNGRPNFLYFITDQQRADWLGCYGHPVVKTPNIDAIAAKGTRFDDLHVAMPVCMPNRASLMTGRMPSVHGLRYNGCQLSRDAVTFVDVLAAAGYDTAAIGKSHLQEFTGQPSWHARHNHLPGRLIEEAWRSGPAPSEEDAENYAATDRYVIETPYYGFRHVDMVTRHGDTCGGHYEQWFREAAPDWRALRDRDNELPHNYSCPQAYRTPIPEALYPTAWVADRAIDYLTDPARAEAPFFAFVSFPDPHHPFNPPGRYWDMYSPEDFELPLPYEAHRNPPPPLRWLHDNFHGAQEQMTKQTAIYAGEQALKEAMALTAGMITMIDDHVGRVVAALRAAGLYDDTVICFNSDHGDYLGDFNLLLKGLLPVRGLTRVPMIWSDPRGRRAGSSDALASTIDIPATILDRAGQMPFYGIQGRSLLPTIETGAGHRDEILIEFNDSAPKFGFAAPARVRTLRTSDWRLSLYAGQDWGELYHVARDPGETQNLWDDPAHGDTRARLTERLAHHLTAQMDESPRAHLVA
ncbi:MAG: sulfatase-like hydrolase/transferase [Rhodobacter sp.]|nr:sulfatase-like hydrolase/transferase [Rhodobacter sp.]